MKVKIVAGFLAVVLFANASSAAYMLEGTLVSVVAASAGIIGTVFAFLPSYGDAGHYEATCGSNVPQCTMPLCSKVEYCFTPSNMGGPFCWHCHGNGYGDGYLARRQYMGTIWGIPVAIVSVLAAVFGTCGVVYFMVKGDSLEDTSYENI